MTFLSWLTPNNRQRGGIGIGAAIVADYAKLTELSEKLLMRTLEYEVACIRGDWHVKFAADLHGPFRSQAEAIATAKSWAIRHPPSVVILQMGPEDHETVWTSSDQPLPLFE